MRIFIVVVLVAFATLADAKFAERRRRGFGNYGGFPDNSQVNPGFDPNFGFPNGGFGYDPYGYGGEPSRASEMINEIRNRIQQQQDALSRQIAEQQRLAQSGGNVHSAISSAGIGPEGGYQFGQINPVNPGIESRFGETLPGTSGGPVAVFSSSSSSTRVGPDGKVISQKSATTGVNDNGKVYVKTVHDP